MTKLSPSGSSLAYSTYLGGSQADEANAIAVDSSGRAYVTGYTQSSNFPTSTGAYQTSLGMSTQAAFVSRFNAAGSALDYSTYLGGAGTAAGAALALDSSNNAYVAGSVAGGFPYLLCPSSRRSAAARRMPL